MARWQATAAIMIGDKKYKAGQTYADTTGNAVAGDVVWAACATHVSPCLVPLDGSATTAKNAGAFKLYPVPTIDGVNSVGGVG